MSISGEEIREFRKKLGLSPAEFARLFGAVHRSTVVGWELGRLRDGKPVKLPATVDKLIRLARDVPRALAWLRKDAANEQEKDVENAHQD
jgi:DNA-binding transcriptional regulator YiaG